jgi:prepilin-type processing-associated H-X9-DG protein
MLIRKEYPFSASAAFTLIELMVVATVGLILTALIAQAGWKVYESSSLAVSANNIRQLSAGASAYLSENDHRFWKFRSDSAQGTVFWFGEESRQSMALPEGKRRFDPSRGPLAGYIPASMRPDPSFALSGSAFKPKYASGYLGIGYNGRLGGGFGSKPPKTYWELSKPSRVVVFATSAQVNTFQRPASTKRPMIEEFYLIDERETTVHFRHGGQAMVAFADGSCGLLPMDPSTRDSRYSKGLIGRFAPVGSTKFLE